MRKGPKAACRGETIETPIPSRVHASEGIFS
jgi:hypothetical protein